MYVLKLLNSNFVTTSRILYSQSSIRKSVTVALSTAMQKKSTEAKRNFCRQTNESVTLSYLEVIGSGADGVPSSVILVTNAGPYLINCGEGTLKLASEYRIRFTKSPACFITYPSWKNIAGLFGVSLTLQDSNVKQFFIHGDSVIEHLFCSSNKFVNLRHIEVKVRSNSPYNEYSDGRVSVKSVHLHPSSKERNFSSPLPESETASLSSDNESEFCNSVINPVCKKNKREKNNKNVVDERKGEELEKQLSWRHWMNYATSYIFRTSSSRGTLNFEKCLEHGVPPGPLLGKLKNGMDVTLENGKVVRSVDVKEPDVPGVTVIAVECPSVDYLDSLLQEPAFFECQSGETPAEAVVHFSSASIIKDTKYQEWINRFPKTTKHLFINEENKRTGSAGIHHQQYKLNLLHPEIFPLLDHSGIPEFPRTDTSFIQVGHTVVTENIPVVRHIPIYKDKVFLKCESNSFIKGETLCEVYLKPKYSYDYSVSLVLKKGEVLKELFEEEGVKEKLEQYKEELRNLEEKIESDNRVYPKIIFLGTGSSKSSKLRNGSGILIFVNSSKCILLDCGEYTFGQLVNFYGIEKTREILRNLQAIYISHMHIDHHLGLVTLLKERKVAFDELHKSMLFESVPEASPQKIREFKPVFLLCPPPMQRWLTFFTDKLEDVSKLYEIIPNSLMLHSNKKENHSLHVCKQLLDLSSITTTYVIHCSNSFGVSLIHKSGWKITYSGDTMPCQGLVEIGMDSDILIHEATLEDIYTREARIKLHSTTQQAIDVGKTMRAKYILLSHFSQRYCHLPNIDSTVSYSNIGIAFDFMEVPFNKLPLLPALLKPLQNVFSKYDKLNKTIANSVLLKKEKLQNEQMNMKEVIDSAMPPAKMSKKTY